MQWFSRKQPSFEELAAQAERQVYGTCFHMMGQREDAEDCAQETMLRAYRAFSSFRGQSSFSTWITRIAINVCTDALRKRRETVSLEDLHQEKGWDAPDKGKSVYGQMEERERLRLLRQAMDGMPEEFRELIVLRNFQDLPYDEIARITGLPLGTVKSRISRAREKLCGLLKKDAELFSARSV